MTRWIQMGRWSTVARFVALCLLMLTGFELVACEMLPGSICELNGSPLDTQEAGDDNCLCCCFHVIPVGASPPSTLVSLVYVFDEPHVSLPAGAVPLIELPPRA
jgi:hypothetical protein